MMESARLRGVRVSNDRSAVKRDEKNLNPSPPFAGCGADCDSVLSTRKSHTIVQNDFIPDEKQARSTQTTNTWLELLMLFTSKLGETACKSTQARFCNLFASDPRAACSPKMFVRFLCVLVVLFVSARDVMPIHKSLSVGSKGQPTYKELYITQNVDNFNSRNKNTFQQRYCPSETEL